MITKFQRHPTEPTCVILHVSGALAACLSTDDGKVIVDDQAYRDALEAAGKLED